MRTPFSSQTKGGVNTTLRPKKKRTYSNTVFELGSFWSKCGDSNSRPPVPETGALPTALHLDIKLYKIALQLSAALPVVTKALPSQLGLLVTRQVTATPYFSLHHPPGALENVPNCATPTHGVRPEGLTPCRWIIRFSQSHFAIACVLGNSLTSISNDV